MSSETRPVVSEDDASSAVSAAEKNAENDAPPPPPRPPPVPMDGPDMTDPANRAALDAYQPREVRRLVEESREARGEDSRADFDGLAS